MSAKIVEGYLISFYEYRSYDKLLKFITKEGKIITCIALGINKITSKNARNLFEGCLLEIEYFESRLPEKISKLKKITLIDSIKKQSYKFSLDILNFLFSKIEKLNEDINVYEMYQYFINLINIQNYNDIFKANFILIKLQILFGFQIKYSSCVYCNTNKMINSISINDIGISCKNCSTKNNLLNWSSDSIKLFFYLSTNKINEAYKYKKANLVLFKFLQKIYLNITGIYIREYYE